jgi:hypothetical protein
LAAPLFRRGSWGGKKTKGSANRRRDEEKERRRRVFVRGGRGVEKRGGKKVGCTLSCCRRMVTSTHIYSSLLSFFLRGAGRNYLPLILSVLATVGGAKALKLMK